MAQVCRRVYSRGARGVSRAIREDAIRGNTPEKEAVCRSRMTEPVAPSERSQYKERGRAGNAVGIGRSRYAILGRRATSGGSNETGWPRCFAPLDFLEGFSELFRTERTLGRWDSHMRHEPLKRTEIDQES